MDIKKPITDEKTYEFLKLDNGLEILIIGNVEGKSMVSMTVGTGFYDDPVECPGLAHFLEHMLFLGSGKYRRENFFQNYLALHGGSSNAYTTPEFTTYFFDVLEDYLEEGLDVFSRFFIDPLFNKESVDREINAVNSEHEKNINSDFWRMRSVLKEISLPSHPYHKFGTGNYKTLQTENIYEKLTSFFKSYYSSNIMKLVIYTNKDIKNKAIQMFSQIKNTNPILKRNKNLPIPPTIKFLQILPISETDKLTLIWQLPYPSSHNKNKVINYISFLLNNNDKKSLKYNILTDNLAIHFDTHILDQDSYFIFFSINITLSQKGLSHIPQIISNIFSYIQQMKFVPELYSDNSKINNIQFNYQDKHFDLDDISMISTNMLTYKNQDLLSLDYDWKLTEKTKIQITSTINKLTPSNLICILSSKSCKSQTNLKEKWYGSKYSTSPTNPYIKTTHSPKPPSFTLPRKNIFIPTTINIVNFTKNSTKSNPTKLSSSPETWFCEKNTYQTPYTIFNILLFTNKINNDKKNIILMNIYLSIYEHYLSPLNYYLNQSGGYLYISSPDTKYLSVRIVTFHEHLTTIIKEFFETFGKIKITESKFLNELKTLKIKYDNIKYSPPSTLIQLSASENIEKSPTIPSLIKQIKNTTYQDLLTFQNNIPTLWHNVKVLIQGNITSSQAKTIPSLINKNINITPSPKLKNKITLLPPGKTLFQNVKQTNPSESNSALYVLYEIEPIKYKTQNYNLIAKITLLEDILSERFFNDLRTKQQLGYIVTSKSTTYDDSTSEVFYISFLIQSNRFQTKDLIPKVQKFINDSQTYLHSMNPKTLSKIKLNKQSELLLTNDNILQNFLKNLNTIKNNLYEFDFKEKLSQEIENISLPDIQNFFEQYLHGKTRKIRIFQTDPNSPSLALKNLK